MYSGADIEAVMTLNDSDYRKKLSDAPGAAQKMLTRVAGLAAGFFAFSKVTAQIKGLVDVFAVQEGAVERVRAALRKQGEEYNLQTQALEKYAGELQNVTTYGGDAILAVMAQGMNMGIAADRIKEATRAAMGLAAVCNLDLNTAMVLVAKANAGNTAALGKYGIQIDSSKSKAEQFNEVLKKGAESFQLAEANAQTLGGRMTSLSNAWDDLQAAVGQFIVELFDVPESTKALTDRIGEVTEYIKKHTAEWVFAAKSVWIEIKAVLQGLWALVEPAITFVVQSAIAGVKNIGTVCNWLYDNIVTIIDNSTAIATAGLQDWWEKIKGYGKLILDYYVYLGKAIWQAITGGGFSGFSKMMDQLTDDMIKNAANAGKKTAEALAEAGVQAFPELESGNSKEMIDKYRNLSETLYQIDLERAKKQEQLEDRYRKQDEAKRKPQQDGKSARQAAAEENGKSSALGSFSAAILEGLLGANRPEEETAKNTKELVRLYREQKGSGGGTLTLT